MEFTYYCGEHRNYTAKGCAPSVTGMNGCPIFNPVCPTCLEQLFYVPNGGNVVPAA